MGMKVFVYGTLKKGHGNHRYLRGDEHRLGAVMVGEAVTSPNYTMLALGGFPGVVVEGQTPIHGEVYELPDGEDGRAMLYRLDKLEGHPSFYQRVPMQVTLHGEDTPIDVEGYVLPEGWLRRGVATIPSGVWGGQ